MKKLTILLLIFFLISLIVLGGCFEEEKSTEKGKETLEGLGYINEVLMYGFNPPEGFYLKEESYFNQYVTFEYIPYANESGQLGLYIYASNISANISFPNRSIDEIAQDLADSLVNSTSYNLYLVSYNFKTVNGMDFYEILLESPIEQLEDHSVFWKYIYVVKDERMIHFQIISSSELYENNIDEIDRSISSLIILELEEEEWDLEKYYSKNGESNNTYIMTAREHNEDRAFVIYFSNIKTFYNSSNAGDTIIIQDTISSLSYDAISKTTTLSFEWVDSGSIKALYLLFEGDITNQYIAGDRVNITVTLKRVTFSYEDVNYDLEVYAESWVSEEYFKENVISATEIAQAYKPLSSNLIEKL